MCGWALRSMLPSISCNMHEGNHTHYRWHACYSQICIPKSIRERKHCLLRVKALTHSILIICCRQQWRMYRLITVMMFMFTALSQATLWTLFWTCTVRTKSHCDGETPATCGPAQKVRMCKLTEYLSRNSFLYKWENPYYPFEDENLLKFYLITYFVPRSKHLPSSL